ncbi:MAG: 50S ribosomal protein L9, partial [Acholeplasmataceae bacterium]
AMNLIGHIQGNGMKALVRVSKNEEVIIKRVLDAGADGVIVPMIRNKEEAEQAVNFVKYPPVGKRGVGLNRAQKYGTSFNEYKKWVEEESVIIAQIEHIDAVFAVGYVREGVVGVSARSTGQINVQIFMEFFGGGGHLTSAAVQKEADIEDMMDAIKQKILLEYGGQDQPMKVILLEDVKGRGKKDDVIEVAGGYGQFLLTQKKGILANEENLKALHDQQEKAFEAQQKHIELMKTLKQEIDHKHIKLTIQVGKDGKLFGAITTKHIVEQFEKDHGITLDKKKVELSSDINSIGIYTVTVHLHKDVDAQFEVHVEQEKKV